MDWKERFALKPTRMTNGSLVWLKRYWQKNDIKMQLWKQK